MRNVLVAAALCAVVGIVVFAGQTPAPQTPAPSADPYANNAAPGTTQFPLAAPAGKDSNARTTAPAGAVNQGPFDPATWKYGTAFNPPPGAKIWNPVKLKMMQGGKVTGGTVFSATDPATYCAMANAGYDFIWTEMQHDQRDWEAVARMWRTCPNAKAVPGVRVAYTDEREIQHALDAGALVVVVPTVDTVEEAIEARNWTYFPPLGRRSNGGGQAFDAGDVGRRARRLSQHDQRQHRADPDDRDARRPEERRRDREGARRHGGVRGERRPRQLLGLSGRARPTTSARSTSCTTRRSRPACGCAVRSRGAIGRTSPASRPAARRRRSRAAWPRSSARSRTRRASRKSVRSPRGPSPDATSGFAPFDL